MNKILRIELTDDQYDALAAEADSAGCSVEELASSKVCDETVSILDTSQSEALWKVLEPRYERALTGEGFVPLDVEDIKRRGRDRAIAAGQL